MAIPLTYEQRIVHVLPHQAEMAAVTLRSLGVSTYSSRNGAIMALMRFGYKGAEDRLAVYQVEMRFSNLSEQKQWLEMCWTLPPFAPVATIPNG